MYASLRATWQSWRSLLGLALPIWLSQLLRIGWGLADTVMLAAFSSQDLAALALSGSFYMALNVAGKGVLQALSPLVAYLHGEQRWQQVGVMTRQACWIALLLAVLGGAVLCSPFYLSLANVDAAVHDKARAYQQAIAFGLIGSFGLRVIGAMMQAVGRPYMLTCLMLAGLALKLPLNYCLVYGAFGVPALGVAGCAMASSVVNLALCALGWLWLWRAPAFARYALFAWQWPQMRPLLELLRLGIPFGLGYWLETAIISAFTLAMSRLGTEALAAGQIAGNYLDMLFTIPLSISLAVAIQMGHSLGAGHVAQAGQAARFGLRAAAACALLAAGGAWLWPELVLMVYRPVPALAPILIGLLGLLVPYHVADALQSVAAFMNRAHRNAWWPALAYAVCMWGVALGLAPLLAFGLSWDGQPRWPAPVPGLAGFYAAQGVGLALAGLLMWVYWRRLMARLSHPY